MNNAKLQGLITLLEKDMSEIKKYINEKNGKSEQTIFVLSKNQIETLMKMENSIIRLIRKVSKIESNVSDVSEQTETQKKPNNNIIQEMEKLKLNNIISIRSLYEKATNAEKVPIRNKVYELMNANRNMSIENKIQIYSIFGTKTNVSKLNSIIESTKEIEILKQILQIQPSLNQKVINKVKPLFANDESNFEILKNKYKNIGLNDIIDLMQTIVTRPEFQKENKPGILTQESLNGNSNKDTKLNILYYLLKTGKINATKADIKLTDILDKPQIILLVNRISKKNNITSELREPLNSIRNENRIDLIPTNGDISVPSVQQFAREKLQEKVEQFKSEKINLFFYGPSGSGKTTMFNAVKSKDGSSIGDDENVIAFVPKVSFQNGILTIGDEEEFLTYKVFKRKYIRSTPFNKDSSRAHMCTREDISFGNKNVKLFDLAGAENPMAILMNTFGFNPFDYLDANELQQIGTEMRLGEENGVPVWIKGVFGMENKSDVYQAYVKYYSRDRRSTQDKKKSPKIKIDKMFLLGDIDRSLHEFALKIVGYLLFGFSSAALSKSSDAIPRAVLNAREKTLGEIEDPQLQFIKDLIYTPSKEKPMKNFYFNKNTPLTVFLIESFKRAIEGFYIIRSLYMIKYPFSKASPTMNNASLLKFFSQQTVNNTNKLSVNDTNNEFQIKFTKELKGKPHKLLEATQQLRGFKDQGQMIVPVPSRPTYKTALLTYILNQSKDGYKNCIVGVINGSAKDDILKQQITAVNYLKTLTVKTMHPAVPM
jgi:hypothetical protein